jgi:serine/threonine protein kinase/tetratricopeptide (TPR) repeat protein
MVEPLAEVNRVDELAEEFAGRVRAGERPSVEEYAERYPQWADELRSVLPAVEMLEQLKPRREDIAGPTTAVTAGALPQRVGEYRIIREIGRGGMGVVYEAEQETLGRRVAIKVLPAHLLANDLLRARFIREANAAGRLHHTNIVPVFGVGECDGQCFYVMQLINGRGLDRVIQELAANRDEGGPPGADFCRTVARIGAAVADALAAAHRQGILHRDIKPSNLLLDDRGTVWVTDFGLAKLVEEVNLTSSGDLVGTLKYMPPERFAGQSEARGDVYSLGVTLYELLTLRSVFPDTTPQHLIHLVTQGTPNPPRKINPHIPKDLETIVLKAMARDPAHRYQTPEELAEDLRRFLDDQPIRARRTGPIELAWRWCRRNPALAAVTATAFLLMVLVSVVSVGAYVQTAAASRATEEALASEKAQRENAEQTATLALDALNRTYDRFAPTRLVVTPPAEDETGVALPAPALPPEAIPLLEDLLRTYEQLARSAGEFPRLHGQAAESNYRIGEIARRLGRFDKAVAAYRTAIDLYNGLPGDSTSSGDGIRIKQARAYNELGRTLRLLQQLDESVRMHRRAIAILTDNPVFAEKPESRYEQARSWCALGQRDMLLSPGGPPGKHDHGPRKGRRGPPPDRHLHHHPGPPEDNPTQRAVALLERLVREFKTVPEYRHLLACCYRDTPPERFGRGKSNRNDQPDRAVQLLRQLVNDFRRVPDYRLDLCEALARPGGPGGPGAEAKKRERQVEAVTLSEQLVAQYPNVPDYTAAHARHLDGLGMTLLRLGLLDEAEKRHRKAVALQTGLVKQYPEVVGYRFWLGLMERSLGKALGELGQLKEARRLIETGSGRVEALWKKDSRLGGARPFLGMAYRDLARVLSRSGETALAAAAERKAEQFGPVPGKGPGPRERRGRP